VRDRAEPEHVGEVDAGRVHARLLEQRVEPGSVRALGQPEAAGPLAALRAAAEGLDPGPYLQPHAGVGGAQRQHRVRGRRRPRRPRHQRPEHVAAERVEARGRARVVGAGALHLVGQHVLAALAQGGDVERVRPRTHIAQEGEEARAGGTVVAERLELVAEDRRDRQRQRRVVGQDVEQRQV
jgi:hypothetical protein